MIVKELHRYILVDKICSKIANEFGTERSRDTLELMLRYKIIKELGGNIYELKTKIKSNDEEGGYIVEFELTTDIELPIEEDFETKYPIL